VDISRLEAGGLRLDSVQTAFYWHGTQVELAGFKALYRGAAVEGRLFAELGAVAPLFRGRFAAGGLDWHGGALSLDAQFRTEGGWPLRLADLSVEGAFSGRSLTVGGHSWERASGCFELAFQRVVARERLPCVELHQGGVTYYGYTTAAEAGRSQLLLFNDAEEVLLGGPLLFGKTGDEGSSAEQQSR
jgi:hypothetical protein